MHTAEHNDCTTKPFSVSDGGAAEDSESQELGSSYYGNLLAQLKNKQSFGSQEVAEQKGTHGADFGDKLLHAELGRFSAAQAGQNPQSRIITLDDSDIEHFKVELPFHKIHFAHYLFREAY